MEATEWNGQNATPTRKHNIMLTCLLLFGVTKMHPSQPVKVDSGTLNFPFQFTIPAHYPSTLRLDISFLTS